MEASQQRYGTTAGLAVAIVIVGWLAIVAGIILIGMGLDGTRYLSWHNLLEAALPGVYVIFSGLMLVVMGQTARILIDLANRMMRISSRNSVSDNDA